MSGNNRGGDFGALTMSEKVEVLDQSGDVVCIPNPGNYGLSEYHRTFLGFELDREIIRLMGKGATANKWVKEGVECLFLSPGGEWKEGKIYLCVKFVPKEEPVQGEFVGEVIHLPPASTEVMPETSDRPAGE